MRSVALRWEHNAIAEMGVLWLVLHQFQNADVAEIVTRIAHDHHFLCRLEFCNLDLVKQSWLENTLAVLQLVEWIAHPKHNSRTGKKIKLVISCTETK